MRQTWGVPLGWTEPQPGQALHALTLPEPLASATLDAGRDVEGRPWFTAPHLIAQARTLIGHSLLIHAGGRYERSRETWIFLRSGWRYASSGVTPRAIIGLVTLVDVGLHSDSPWFEPGMIALSLSWPVRLLEPIPVRGQRGLWVPDAQVQERVRRQLAFLARAG